MEDTHYLNSNHDEVSDNHSHEGQSLKAILENDLAKRKLKNRNYSLRAYARDLKVSASTLSKILNDKYILNDKIIISLLTEINYEKQLVNSIVIKEKCKNFCSDLKEIQSLQNLEDPEFQDILKQYQQCLHGTGLGLSEDGSELMQYWQQINNYLLYFLKFDVKEFSCGKQN